MEKERGKWEGWREFRVSTVPLFHDDKSFKAEIVYVRETREGKSERETNPTERPLPSRRRMACLRRVWTRSSSSSISCSLATICSSLRHTLSWAYRPSGISLCWPMPMSATSRASAR